MSQKPRPNFLSVELDPIDARLEAKAAEKGIPTLVNPKPEAPKPEPQTITAAQVATPLPAPTPAPTSAAAPKKRPKAGQGAQSTPRDRMRGLKIELPDYVWISLKKRAAEDMVSLRHVIMTALRAQGIAINEADMIEDGRRLRGPDAQAN